MLSGLKERFYKIEFIPYLVLGLALLILVLFIAYPLSKVLLNSFLRTDDVFSLQNLTLANFSQFFSSSLYKSALMNTLLVGFLCVLFSCLLGIPMAYFLARTEIPFKTVILTLCTVLINLPPDLRAHSNPAPHFTPVCGGLFVGSSVWPARGCQFLSERNLWFCAA